MNIEQIDNIIGLTFDTSGYKIGNHLKFLVQLEHTLQHDSIKSKRIKQALEDSSKVHIGDFTLIAYMTITATPNVTNAIFVEENGTREVMVVYVNAEYEDINIQFALSPSNRNKGFYAYRTLDVIDNQTYTIITDKI